MYARPMLRLAARKAAHIFTVSEYSKQRIVEHLNVPSEKVTVTYNGVGPQFFPESREKARQTVQRECGVARPYVLYVGNLKPHKNVDGLLRAFALAWRRTAGAFELLIIGDDASGGPALKDLAANLGIAAATKFAGRVSDEVLRCAYSAAELTVLPSFEEGFGLPVLESMACGTPVACSRVASLPEVAGNAAEYFDPHDIESIAATIERLLHSDGDRARLRELGISNAQAFHLVSLCRPPFGRSIADTAYREINLADELYSTSRHAPYFHPPADKAQMCAIPITNRHEPTGSRRFTS